jgi:hypothetical protein
MKKEEDKKPPWECELAAGKDECFALLYLTQRQTDRQTDR